MEGFEWQNPECASGSRGRQIDFIHADDDLDPLLRMAITHHQFESIHPFYDGNGRTGRILNLLMLQRDGLLDLPVLYLSRYITTTKRDYYRLLQTVRDENLWVDWCLYLLRGVAVTSRSAIALVKAFCDLMLKTKHDLRERVPKLYSQDLLNNLFRYPYKKIEFIENELGVSAQRPASIWSNSRQRAWCANNGSARRTSISINRCSTCSAMSR